MVKPDVKYKIKEQKDFQPMIIKNKKIETSYNSGKLILLWEGKDLTTQFINTLRRVMLNRIPTYAFSDQRVIIYKNSSIFNNDYMKLRLSQLPIPNITSDIDYLDVKTCLNFDDKKEIKIVENEQTIELNINVCNKTASNINVTTDDITLYVNDKLIQNPYQKYGNILLIQLRSDQEFIAKMTASLNIGEKSDIWAAASNVFYDYDTEKNTCQMTICSQGQISELTILKKALKYIQLNVSNLEKEFQNYITKDKENENDNDNLYIFKLPHEYMDIGYLLNDLLQNHNSIIFSGIFRENLFINTITIRFNTKENFDKILREIFDYVKSLCNIA